MSNTDSSTQQSITLRPEISLNHNSQIQQIQQSQHTTTHQMNTQTQLHQKPDFTRSVSRDSHMADSPSALNNRVPRIGRPESFEQHHHQHHQAQNYVPHHQQYNSAPQSHVSTPTTLQRKLPLSADSVPWMYGQSNTPTSNSRRLVLGSGGHSAQQQWRMCTLRLNSHHAPHLNISGMIPQSILDQPAWAEHSQMRHKYTAPDSFILQQNASVRAQIQRRFSEAAPLHTEPGYTISPITGEIKRPRARKFPKDYWAPKPKEALSRDWRRAVPLEEEKFNANENAQKASEQKENPPAEEKNEKMNETKAQSSPVAEEHDALAKETPLKSAFETARSLTPMKPIDRKLRSERLFKAFATSAALLMACSLLILDKQQSAAVCTFVVVLVGGFYALRMNFRMKDWTAVDELSEEGVHSPPTNSKGTAQSTPISNVVQTSQVSSVKDFDRQKDCIKLSEKASLGQISPTLNEQYESAAHSAIAASPSLRPSESIVERNATRKEVH